MDTVKGTLWFERVQIMLSHSDILFCPFIGFVVGLINLHFQEDLIESSSPDSIFRSPLYAPFYYGVPFLAFCAFYLEPFYLRVSADLKELKKREMLDGSNPIVS